ncbi:unnamed protein product, partial [Iphiclides podalirius]
MAEQRSTCVRHAESAFYIIICDDPLFKRDRDVAKGHWYARGGLARGLIRNPPSSAPVEAAPAKGSIATRPHARPARYWPYGRFDKARPTLSPDGSILSGRSSKSKTVERINYAAVAFRTAPVRPINGRVAGGTIRCQVTQSPYRMLFPFPLLGSAYLHTPTEIHML